MDTNNKYPYVVQIVDENGIHKCGGTLITLQHVLTIRDCAKSNYEIWIHYGRATIFRFKINSDNTVFKNFHLDPHENDLAIVKVINKFY